MKKITYIICNIIFFQNGFCQNNLISNTDFENIKGGGVVRCEYGFSSPSGVINLDDDIQDWINAKTPSGAFKRSSADWMDDVACTTSTLPATILPPASRFVYLEETGS